MNQIVDIQDLFTAVKTNKLSYNQIEKIVSIITEGFQVNRLSNLVKDFESYYKREQLIYSSSLTLEQVKTDFRNNYYNLAPDPFQHCDRFLFYLNEKLVRLKLETVNYSSALIEQVLIEPSNDFDDVKEKLWFIAGLAIANGTIAKEMANGKTPRKIAIELGNKNLCNYITFSLANNPHQDSNRDKNVFLDKAKLAAIIEYCSENGIKIVEEFNKRIPKND